MNSGSFSKTLGPVQQKNVSNPDIPYSDEVTLVTAFFNIGDFKKGLTRIYTPNMYKKWMRIFSKISNPIVAYFDDQQFYEYFKSLRTSSNRTRIFSVQRKDLWAFSLLPNITKIFSDPNYPKFSPNTVVPEYSCVMHAKYELLLKTIESNPFRTSYFAWIDIGLFRNENASLVKMFHMGLPPKFNKKKIAYNEVWKRVTLASPDVIFTINAVWVCGCFFIGYKTEMIKWIHHYMNYTVISLSKGLMNTDQQVIYAMVNDKSYHLDTSLQIYGPRENWGGGKWDRWFHLGYLCKIGDSAK